MHIKDIYIEQFISKLSITANFELWENKYLNLKVLGQ